mmetsp:Transcript_8771/g.15853  ORF Transcript_8771/g.15853 Transcript_8771/m.15853 type:complete len:628 (-) Transcript_8771:117-2000(-)
MISTQTQQISGRSMHPNMQYLHHQNHLNVPSTRSSLTSSGPSGSGPGVNQAQSGRRRRTSNVSASSQDEEAPISPALSLSDDPPDHMEERARRIQKNMHIIKRTSSQSSSSNMSTSSSTSVGSANIVSPVIIINSPRRMAGVPACQTYHRPSSYQKQQQQHHQQHHQQQQFIQKKNYQRGVDFSKSISPSATFPIPSVKSSLSSNSHPVVLETMDETSSETTETSRERAIHHRGRRQSPHPVDILRGQAKNDNMMAASTPPLIPEWHNFAPHISSPGGGSSSSNNNNNSDTIPTFSIGNTLSSSESAEELRHLIAAMQNEFQRLRSSKIQAEAKAEKLQTDLSIQRQEMEQHFENLSMENERLKSISNEHRANLENLSSENERLELVANENNANFARVLNKVRLLENENRSLQGGLGDMQAGREVAEARALAAEERASVAEEECGRLRETMMGTIRSMEKNNNSNNINANHAVVQEDNVAARPSSSRRASKTNKKNVAIVGSVGVQEDNAAGRPSSVRRANKSNKKNAVNATAQDGIPPLVLQERGGRVRPRSTGGGLNLLSKKKGGKEGGFSRKKSSSSVATPVSPLKKGKEEATAFPSEQVDGQGYQHVNGGPTMMSLGAMIYEV